jgi:succinyl-CoA synthetase beta subunit
MQLITHQTGPEGQKVRHLLIEEGADIKHEYYVAALTDRATQSVAIMASYEGGMDIEEVAHKTPEKIVKVFVNPLVGLTDEQALTLAKGMGMNEASIAAVCRYAEEALHLLHGNRRLAGRNQPADPRRRWHRQGARRQVQLRLQRPLPPAEEIVAMRDLDEEDADEIEASKFDLAYISLDGNIGCLVNGAGLAMATMDTIKLFGAEPANFLDVGGGATTEKVTEAFKIMLKNPKVKGILVNIFGGIMKLRHDRHRRCRRCA